MLIISYIQSFKALRGLAPRRLLARYLLLYLTLGTLGGQAATPLNNLFGSTFGLGFFVFLFFFFLFFFGILLIFTA